MQICPLVHKYPLWVGQFARLMLPCWLFWRALGDWPFSTTPYPYSVSAVPTTGQLRAMGIVLAQLGIGVTTWSSITSRLNALPLSPLLIGRGGSLREGSY